MMEDGIREIYGSHPAEADVDVRAALLAVETKDTIMIYMPLGCSKQELTPEQSRYFARKLYRLAKRVEYRQEHG